MRSLTSSNISNSYGHFRQLQVQGCCKSTGTAWEAVQKQCARLEGEVLLHDAPLDFGFCWQPLEPLQQRQDGGHEGEEEAQHQLRQEAGQQPAHQRQLCHLADARQIHQLVYLRNVRGRRSVSAIKNTEGYAWSHIGWYKYGWKSGMNDLQMTEKGSKIAGLHLMLPASEQLRASASAEARMVGLEQLGMVQDRLKRQ